MIWDRSLHALIPRNPLILRDLRHQQRTISLWRRRIESVGVVALALCFLTTMLFCVVYMRDPQDPYSYYVVLIQLLAWIFHALTVLRLLAAGVFIATPEGYFLGSDELKLTRLSSWQLFTGKWWVAMHQVRGWIVALGIVQLGIVVSTAFGLLMTAVDWSGGGLIYPEYFTLALSTLIVVCAIGIAVLEAACCTALGLTLAIFIRSNSSFICAIVVRFAPVLIFSIVPNYKFATGDFTVRFAEYTWFSFADAGTGAIIELAQPDNVVWGVQGSGVSRGMLAIYADVGMFFTYLSLSFVLAWLAARRSRNCITRQL